MEQAGYRVELVFLWLPSADLAVARVADRVRLGGPEVPEETVRRRFAAGLRNFFSLYQPLANSWRIYDNASGPKPRLVALGQAANVTRIVDQDVWARIRSEVERE